MGIFYHLDRTSDLLLEKDILDLKPLINKISINDIELFSDGISKHGERYIDLNCYNSDSIIELTLELVRQKYFEDKPSRLQSLFAFENLQEAVNFKNKYHANGEFCVWELESETSFKADMNLLSVQIKSNKEFLELADKYWKGEASESPIWEYLLPCPVKKIKRICSSEVDYYLSRY